METTPGSAQSNGAQARDDDRFTRGSPLAARVEPRCVAIADIDQDIRLVAAVGKELRVDLGAVETSHRAGVEAERAQGQDEIAGLQSAVLTRRAFRGRRVCGEVVLQVHMRKEPRQMLEELRVEGEDRGNGSSHGLVDIAG